MALTDGFPVFTLGSMKEDGTRCTRGMLVRLEDLGEQEMCRRCENFTGSSSEVLGQVLVAEYTHVSMFADEAWLSGSSSMPDDRPVDNLFRRPNPLAQI